MPGFFVAENVILSSFLIIATANTSIHCTLIAIYQ